MCEVHPPGVDAFTALFAPAVLIGDPALRGFRHGGLEGEQMPSKKTRRYTYLTEEEDRKIERKAAMSGRSVSAFLKDSALGYLPAMLIPPEQFEGIMGLKADLRRLGNLLKSSAFGGYAERSSSLMGQIQEVLSQISGILKERGL